MTLPGKFEVTFPSYGKLNVRVNMTGERRVFNSGNQGFYFHDRFDWDGRIWKIRFLAVALAGKSAPDTTLGRLQEAAVDDVTPAPAHSSAVAESSELEKLHALVDKHLRWMLENQDRRAAGWHLVKSKEGVEGWFELAGIRKLPSHKEGSFASFEVHLDSGAYLGQFHIAEVPCAMEEPTAWDDSRGAKAGLPSLGKRK